MKEKGQEEIEYNLAREKECKDRLKTLEKLMCKIYEDIILEKIPNTRYEVLNTQYEDEQLKLTDELKEIEKKIQY